MKTPLVSVCVPAYRAARFLGEAIDSVAAQTFKDWELIVIEDGSDDGTREIVASFAASVPQRVHYTRHPINLGLPTARNNGFREAAADWIAILDADDLWAPGHLASLVSRQHLSASDLVYSASQIFESETGRSLELRGSSAEQAAAAAANLFNGNLVIQPSSVMFRRRILGSVGGFQRRFRICNDLEFWLRLATSGYRFGFTGSATCRYRKHAAAMSNQSADLIAEVAQIRRLYSDRVVLGFWKRRWLVAKAYFDAARISRRRHPRQALSCVIQAISSLIPS